MKKTIRILLLIFTIMFLASYFSGSKNKLKNLVGDYSYNNRLMANIRESFINTSNKKILSSINEETSVPRHKENKYISFINNKMSNLAYAIKNNFKSEIQQDNEKYKKNKNNQVNLEQKQIEEVKILSNKSSKTPDELDKDIRLNHKPLYTSDKVRLSTKDEIYKELGEKNTKSLNREVSACYYVLTQVLDDDRYKELINKNNKNWDSYKQTNLYCSIDYLKEAINLAKNTSLQNDLERAYDLCVYGVKNNDVVALIDAKRIIGDIECHILKLSSKTGFLALNENYKEESTLYYGATELLEGENYHLIGEYICK